VLELSLACESLDTVPNENLWHCALLVQQLKLRHVLQHKTRFSVRPNACTAFSAAGINGASVSKEELAIVRLSARNILASY
jgi:hypothetical protein